MQFSACPWMITNPDVLDDFEKNGIYQLKKYQPLADKAPEAS